MKPGVRENFNQALKKLPLRRRFIVTVAAYTGVIILLWAGCYSIAYRAVSRSAAENAALASGDLIGRISAEFSQMRTIASVIASSSYVQDFLSERDVAAYYQKAGVVSEIIQKAAFPITSSDSIIAFNEGGDFFRFSGGLSNASCEEIHQNFRGAGAFYTIIELDGTLFFCHSAPVFDTSGRTPVRIGSIAILTGLDKTRRMLEHDGIDMALILGGEVVLSNNRSLEGMRSDGLAPRYGMVSVAAIAGTPLTVAAAIPRAAVFPGSRLFIFMGLAALFLLLTGIAGLYHFLSGYMIRPMADIIAGVRQVQNSGRLADTGIADFDALVGDINDMLERTERYNRELLSERQKLFDAQLLQQKMRMGLLASQMDAHFVVNTLKSIKYLSEIGENGSAAEMAEGLAAILNHRHTGDELVNIFVDLEMLRNYIDIMNLKFGGKFTVEYDLDYDLEACLIPGMILQPIVENALHHGLGAKERGAKLVIKGVINKDGICFTFTDNGAGIPPDKLGEIRDSLAAIEISDFPEPGLRGVALANIQRRIRLRFGDAYGVSIDSESDKGTTVMVTLPRVLDQ